MRGGRRLHEEMYAYPRNRYTCDDIAAFNGRQEDAVDAEAHSKAVALVPRDPPTSEMTVDQLLVKANQLHHLLDRFIACRPVGESVPHPSRPSLPWICSELAKSCMLTFE